MKTITFKRKIIIFAMTFSMISSSFAGITTSEAGDIEENSSKNISIEKVEIKNTIKKANTQSVFAQSFSSWDDVPSILPEGEYDFSNLEEKAGSYDDYKVSPKEIIIDGSKVKITNANNKTIKYIQFNLKNSAELTINNVKVDNYRPSTVQGNSYDSTPSVIKILDYTDNKIIVEGTENYLAGSESGAVISVNHGKKATIIGDSESMLHVVGGTSTKHGGAGIGGDFNLVNGDIIFEGKLTIDLEQNSDGAGIGTGYMNSSGITFDKNQVTGSILFTDDVKIKIFSMKSTAIGSARTNNANHGIFSPKINIEKNANIHATTRGYNISAIGNAEGTQLGQINIRDNSTVVALNNADYDTSKYQENMGFGNFKWAATGSGIGFQEKNTNNHENDFDYINISGNPTIVTGGSQGGITIPNGRLNISGGNIKIFARSAAGIGTSIPWNPKDTNNLKSEINISGENTKIEILGRHTVTQEDVDSKIPGGEVGKIIDNYHPGIGLNVSNDVDKIESVKLNIKDATVDVCVGNGAGIGGSGTNTRKIDATKSYSKIAIDNAIVNSKSYRGSGIGSGFMSNDKWDVKIKNNAKIEAKSLFGGAGIGAGMGQKSYSGETLVDRTAFAGNIVIDNSDVLAGSLFGAGIGGGMLNEFNIAGQAAGNQTPRNIDTEGTLKILNDANVKAYSNAFFKDLGVNSYSYRDAITAKLLPDSMKVMASHTFAPEADINDEIIIKAYDKNNNKLVSEIKLEKNMKSYAYSIPEANGDTYIENAVDKNGNSFRIIQYENKDLGLYYREEGRHPSLDSFSSVTQYKGASEEVLNDNTYVLMTEIYKVTYDGNGHTSGTVPEDKNEYKKGEKVTLKDNEGKLEKDGYKFIGWNTEADGSGTKYNIGSEFKIVGDTTLYAIWEKEATPGGGSGGGIVVPPTKKSTAVLANGSKYTDVLTATVLANEKNCPILLTRTDSISTETLNELKRRGTGDIIISGGLNSVSKKVEEQLKGFNIVRYAGADRYGTAREIGRAVRTLTGKTDGAMLVDGTNFPDVITISALATQKRVPILLTNPNKLTSTTENVVKEWKLSDIVIGGNTNSVAKNIQDRLNTDLKISSVSRIGGADRYETASLIGKEVRALTGNKTDMILVNGTDFPDGITINALAAKFKAPIHLTRPNNLVDITAKDMSDWKIDSILVGGGENSVSKSIYDGLKVANKERISGADRYSTAVKISQRLDRVSTPIGK